MASLAAQISDAAQDAADAAVHEALPFEKDLRILDTRRAKVLRARARELREVEAVAFRLSLAFRSWSDDTTHEDRCADLARMMDLRARAAQLGL